MEDVLAVYTRPRDCDCPLVCLDETSKQLIAETRVPIPMKPGRPARCDYEYERNGTANLFMLFAPLEGWRHVKVTDRHTAVDYAHVLRDLADVHFADAKTIVLVQDKGVAVAVQQTTGRQSLNIHGAINLETGHTQMVDTAKVNAESVLKLLAEVESAHPQKKRIHVFLDNASYHHANLVKDWLAIPGRKCVLHFIPPYCPHLDPIERLWGLMHQNITHNRDYKTFRQFRRAIIQFLRHTVPKNWHRFRDRITDNFRVIHRADFRVLA
jgi:transposase